MPKMVAPLLVQIQGLTKDRCAGCGEKDGLSALLPPRFCDVGIGSIQDGRAVFGVVGVAGDEVDEVPLEQLYRGALSGTRTAIRMGHDRDNRITVSWRGGSS